MPDRNIIIGGIFSLLLLLAGAAKYMRGGNDGYYEQENITSEFFNTTPRIREKERIIVVYKDNQLVKQTQLLNNKGEVIETTREVSDFAGRVKRDGEILRSGEALQDGDVIGDDIIEKDGQYFRVVRTIQDGEIIEQKVPLNEDEMAEVVLSEFTEGEKTISESDEKREKIFIDGNGEISKITQYLDEEGNVIEEHIESLAEVREGEILDVQVIKDADGNEKHIRKVIKNGKVVIEEEIVPGKKPMTPKDYFNLSRPVLDELDAREKRFIEAARDNSIYSGEVISISQSKAKPVKLGNRDRDYSAHEEPMTIPTYPVDLERVITSDKFIPAVLYTEVNSHIASSKVIAVVEQDITGSHGRKILVPRGSKVIGAYEPISAIGSERMDIVWNRILTPEGINIKFEAEISDAEGSAGVTGKIDRRVNEKYAEAFLFSTISALTQLTVPVDDEQAKAAADVFTNEIGSVSAELLRKSLNLLPKITIPKGSRITISPLMDIWFKRPQGKVVNIERLDTVKELAEN